MKFRLLLILFLLFCGWASLQAEIKVIPEREYFDIVHGELTRAQQSIDITMYLIKLGNDTPQVKTLLDNLWSAQKRGVKVKVMLDDQRENEEAYQYLKEKVSIQFDSPEIKTHAKKILIDNRRLIIGSSNWTESAFNKNHEANVLVDLAEEDRIILLEGQSYLEKLLEELRLCQKSLDIIIYLINFETGLGDGPVNKIIAEIYKAHERGVKIRIILDSWEEDQFSQNTKAYSLLELAGIDVYYDLTTQTTHNKVVVIDGREVFLGSHNWTESALGKNVESSIFISLPETAKYFSNEADRLIEELPERVNKKWVFIPEYFLEKGGPLQRLFSTASTHSLKLYLHLLAEAARSGKTSFGYDYKGWHSGIYSDSALPWTNSKGVMMSGLLRTLSREGLMARDISGRELTLLDPVTRGPWLFPQQDYLSLSLDFFDKGWLKKLSAREIFFYLINLLEFKRSSTKPFWFDSRGNLAKEYGMHVKTISDAAFDLMAHNLIEIVHDIPDPGQPMAERKANRYLLNPLFSEAELQKEWGELQLRHGAICRMAMEWAREINEPEDPHAVATLVMFAKIYGQEAVGRVIHQVKQLSFGNGKWELRYISGILKKDYTPR